jgi:homogentisate 1,2-dioxygenase
MQIEELEYLTGFGNALSSEAREGALPPRQNTPRKVPFGLYAEQINGTGFTLERSQNQRVWLYRLRPQLVTSPWEKMPSGRFAGSFDEGLVSPELLRFAPQPFPESKADFIDGVVTFAGAGDPCTKTGFAVHLYAANADMGLRAFSNLDADMLVVPQEGVLRVQTELGWLSVAPGEILILPRGIRFRVELPQGRGRGFVGELFNGHYQLPERGVVGANGLADERHFKAPVAAFEDRDEPFEIVHKQGGDLWRASTAASPFDVVAWQGRYLPFKFDLMDFNAYWGANWDHSDPSILTVLTSPHDDHGRNAVDFAVFRGRWDATEDTFRPPYLHRNSAVEFNAVIKSPRTKGAYRPGAVTYTPYLVPHGVSVSSYEAAVGRSDESANEPRRSSDDELWIQFESTYPLRVMPWMLDSPERDHSYLEQFVGFRKAELD